MIVRVFYADSVGRYFPPADITVNATAQGGGFYYSPGLQRKLRTGLMLILDEGGKELFLFTVDDKPMLARERVEVVACRSCKAYVPSISEIVPEFHAVHRQCEEYHRGTRYYMAESCIFLNNACTYSRRVKAFEDQYMKKHRIKKPTIIPLPVTHEKRMELSK